jgi:hypothetical protein
MRTCCFLAVLAILTFAGAASDDDNPETRPILDKAIKALGGEEKLSKVKTVAWKRKMKGLGQIPWSMNIDEVIELPVRFRSVWQMDDKDEKSNGKTVFDGHKGWTQRNGAGTKGMDKEAIAIAKSYLIRRRFMWTVFPLRGKEFKLTAAGEEKVGDRPAVGIEVAPPDSLHFRMYFDKQSGLLVKWAETVKVPETGREVTLDWRFSDYKNVQGIQIAMRSESKRMVEEITDFKFLDKLDEKLFAKP